MSAYMYRVTTATVRLANGEIANVAVFDHKQNHPSSASQPKVRTIDLSQHYGWVVLGEMRGNRVVCDLNAIAVETDMLALTDFEFDRLILNGAYTSGVCDTDKRASLQWTVSVLVKEEGNRKDYLNRTFIRDTRGKTKIDDEYKSHSYMY